MFDTSLPVSDFIPASKIPDPSNVNLWCKVSLPLRYQRWWDLWKRKEDKKNTFLPCKVSVTRKRDLCNVNLWCKVSLTRIPDPCNIYIWCKVSLTRIPVYVKSDSITLTTPLIFLKILHVRCAAVLTPRIRLKWKRLSMPRKGERHSNLFYPPLKNLWKSSY